MNILKQAVEDYMESKWKDHKIAVTYYQAREELLHCATLYVNVPGTTVPAEIWAIIDGEVKPMCNPIGAYDDGSFPSVFVKNEVEVFLYTQMGAAIASTSIPLPPQKPCQGVKYEIT